MKIFAGGIFGVRLAGSALSLDDRPASQQLTSSETEAPATRRAHNVSQHPREALRVAYLILHVVVPLENGEGRVRIRFHHGLAVFEVILRTAEFKERAPLQRVRQGRKRLVLKAVVKLAAHVPIGQRLARGYKIRLDGVIVAPQYFFQRSALRPVKALYSEIEKRRHHPARRPAYLRELPAVEENMLHGQLRLRQKRHGEIRPDRGRDDQRKARHALRPQKFLHLPHLVRLSGVFLPRAVDRGRGQDAEIVVLHVLCHGFAAASGHAHGVKEQHRRLCFIPEGFKNHYLFHLASEYFRDFGEVLPRLLEVRQHTVAVHHARPRKGRVRNVRPPARLLKVRQRAVQHLICGVDEVYVANAGKVAA